MSLFKRKVYTQEEINQQVTNLERLNKLLDMCLQKKVVMSVQQAEEIDLFGMVARYKRNIETGQLYLTYMQERVVGKK